MFGLRTGATRCVAISRPSVLLRPKAPLTLPTKVGRRAASQHGFPGGRPSYRGGPGYNRLHRIQGLKELWYQSPAFRYAVYGASGLGGTFYYYNLEEVPVCSLRDLDDASSSEFLANWLS